MSYAEEYRRSIEDPDGFWAEQAQAVDWYRPPQIIRTRTDSGMDRWFPDAALNTAYLCLDRHVEGDRGDQCALIYDSPVTGAVARYSYRALRDAVARTAGMLRGLGIACGDRVVIYMPMVPEAVIAMLACARLGAIHSVVFGGFAARELATRIDDAQPAAVLTASCGIEADRIVRYKPLIDEAWALARWKARHCVVLQRPQAQAQLIDGRDHDWAEALARADPAECVAVRATDPLYILYTSGTTGHPRGVVRDNGSHAVALLYSMRCIYGMRAGEVFWAASDVG